jgi:DNA-binding transcriptional LysR family regulator
MGAEDLNFHQLQLFYRVAKLRSISRAAKELRISQPSVSKQVREFEQRCGIDLLHRLPRGVALTDAGDIVFDHAEGIFGHAAKLHSVLENLRGTQTGALTVGGSLTAGEYFLPSVAGRFRARYPGVELTISLDNSIMVLAEISQGALDVGFVGTDASGADFVAIPCWEDEIVIIAPPQSVAHFPSVIHLIRSQHFVMREPGSATRQHVEQCLRANGLTVKTALTVGSPEAVKRHVAAGVGWGFASKCSVAAEVATGRLAIVSIEGWDCRRVFCAVHRRGYAPSAAQRAFIEIAQTSTADASPAGVARAGGSTATAVRVS